MAINFPDPSASPWYNDPATGGNGVTYEYTAQGYWKAVTSTESNAVDIGTGDARYVNISGDSMTGNLTIGPDAVTDNITLAADGSAEFSGNVISGSFDTADASGKGVQIGGSYGGIDIQRSAGEFLKCFQGTTKTIGFDSTGSASFAGAVDVGPNATSSDNPLVTVGNYGRRGSFVSNGPRSSANSAGAFKVLVADADGSNEEATVNIWQSGIANFYGVNFDLNTEAANTLNDYEEGTFSPFLGGAGSINYAVRTGYYVKIGGMVHIKAVIAYDSFTPNTNLYIFGLPFARKKGWVDGGTNYIDDIRIYNHTTSNKTHAYGYLNTDNFYPASTGSTLANANPFGGSAATIHFELTYFTDY